MRRREQFIAHVRRNANGECVTQPLDEHLNAVAKLAGEFAAEFGKKKMKRKGGTSE